MSLVLVGCDVSTDTGQDSEKVTEGEKKSGDESLEDREVISLWFWGAEPYAQDAMNEILVDAYNESQDKYRLAVEFRPTVDSDLNTALAANEGPDIVYGSGPAFVMPLVEADKLEKDRKSVV